MTPIFDGHNDVLLRLMLKSEPDGGAASFLEGDGAGHLDLPRAREGGFAGGLFAVFVPPAKRNGDSDKIDKLMQAATYDVPLPVQSELTQAQGVALQMVSLLFRIVRRSDGAVRLCRDVSEIRASMDASALATVLHIEGAEPIDRDFRMLEVLYEAGLRSLGLVWSRPNIFGHGVPFRFPSTPDTGPGLTDEGRALVRACNELGIMVDLSHLNEKGFWDVAELSTAPLVATHSNVHALSEHSRNLTDKQLAAIRESDGMVGLNFATCFLRADGRMRSDTPLSDMVRHTDYLIEHLGEDRVGFGSDFDGAVVAEEIGTVAGLPRLVEAFRAAGYGEALLRKLCFDNWLGRLERTWSVRSSKGAGSPFEAAARGDHGGGVGVGDGAGAELVGGHLLDNPAVLHHEKPLA
jgi:membrane dipeptidase